MPVVRAIAGVFGGENIFIRALEEGGEGWGHISTWELGF
jgi:hypothetical protein